MNSDLNAAGKINVAAASFHNLALAYRAEGKNREAEENYRQAIDLQPDYAEAHYNLAVLLQEVERSSESKVHYEGAIAAKPAYLQALNNLGTIFDEEGDHTAAERLYRQALDINPDVPEVLSSLGSCLHALGRYEEAAYSYMKAIAIRPIFPAAQWNLGFLELSLGRYLAGWSNYRYRHSADRVKFPTPNEELPLDLDGSLILIGNEQGLGDELFFLRFCAQLKQRGAEIHYQSGQAIETLCQRIDGIDALIQGPVDDGYTIADLPFLLRCSEAVGSVSILPLEDRLNAMRSRLFAEGPAPYIGITYRAGIAEPGSLFKEAPIDGIASALKNIEATIIVVQRDPQDRDIEFLEDNLDLQLTSFAKINDDLEDMLALLALLDDYVGVSNTNMHLRAAVAKPARVLVTHPGEYRWMAEGHQSPWFPGFKLYRQGVDGDWQRAFDDLATDLKAVYG